MDQSFNRRAKLYEGAKRRDTGDFALDDFALLELLNLAHPGVVAHLFDG